MESYMCINKKTAISGGGTPAVVSDQSDVNAKIQHFFTKTK